MCSTILAGPDETITKKINETLSNSTIVDKSVSSGYLDGRNDPCAARKSTDKLLEKLDMTSLRRAGMFLAEPKCFIYLSGFNEHQQEQLRRCLKLAGAAVMNQLTSSVTHVIVNNTLMPEHIKHVNTLKLNPHFVGLQWLVESMQLAMAVPESDFYVAVPEIHCKSSHRSANIRLGNPIGPQSRSNDMSIKKPICDDTATNEDQLEDDILAQYRNATATPKQLVSLENQAKQTVDGNTGDTTISFKLPENVVVDTIPCAEEDMEEHYHADNIRNPLHNSNDDNVTSDELTESKEHGTEDQRFFVGMKFTLLEFDEENVTQLSECVKKLGGIVVQEDYDGILNYLIVPPISDLSLHQHFRAQNIVSNYWLEDCLEQGYELEIKYYHHPIYAVNENKSCKGIVIGITGYISKEREFISTVAEALGMIAQEIFAKREKRGALRSTHLICAYPEGAKYEAGIKWDLPVVNKDWLLACLRDNDWVSEKQFLVGDATKFTTEKLEPKLGSAYKYETWLTKETQSFTIKSSAIKNDVAKASTNKIEPHAAANKCKTPISIRPSVVADFETPHVTPLDKIKLNPKPRTFVLTPFGDETFSRLPPESQPSPSTMKRKREAESKYSTPFILRNVKTPDTPYGAFLGKNPSKETRKFWKLQCDELGRFEYTEEQRAELEAKKDRIAQYAKECEAERENSKMDKEYEEYFKNALDPQKTKEMHQKTFKRCGVPLLEPGGKTFDELMEEKMQKQGVSWKNPKRFKLANLGDDPSITECSKQNRMTKEVNSTNGDISMPSEAAAELSAQLAKFEELAQLNTSNANVTADTSANCSKKGNKYNNESGSKRRSSMKMTLSSVGMEPERCVDIEGVPNRDKTITSNVAELESDSQIRWVNPKEEEERKKLSAKLALESQDIPAEEHNQNYQVIS
jgi:hypothetical protein